MAENAEDSSADRSKTKFSCFFCEFKSSKAEKWAKHLKQKHNENMQSLIDLETFINAETSESKQSNGSQCFQRVKKEIHVDDHASQTTLGQKDVAMNQSYCTQSSRKNVGCKRQASQMASFIPSSVMIKRNIVNQKPEDQAENENNITEPNFQDQEANNLLLENMGQNASNQPVALENMETGTEANGNTNLKPRLVGNFLETIKKEGVIRDSHELGNSTIFDLNPRTSHRSCPYCKFVFRREKYLMKHLMSCNFISLQAAQNNDVDPNFEEENISTGVLDGKTYFKCPKCSKLFVNLVEQTRHLALHCTLCPYIGEGPEILIRHRRTHLVDRPFECEYCDFKASVKAAVVAHTRIHTQERPFSCELCDYTGKTATHLKIHQAKHSASKAFSCDICGRQFSQKSSLNRHLRSDICNDLKLA